MNAMIDKLKARLVDDWKQSWRWFSVQLQIMSGALVAAYVAAPAAWQAAIPKGAFIACMAVLALSTWLARVVKQEKK